VTTTDFSRFADNLPRLFGLHNISATTAAECLDMSPQHMWMLINERRNPTYERLRAIEDLFGIHHDRLVDASFEELLQAELADPKRYREAEKRIEIRRKALRSQRGKGAE
jgi:transcriptional regulator with XRE-family HTH domain